MSDPYRRVVANQHVIEPVLVAVVLYDAVQFRVPQRDRVAINRRDPLALDFKLSVIKPVLADVAPDQDSKEVELLAEHFFLLGFGLLALRALFVIEDHGVIIDP
jgi:hypothetical protein